MLLPLKDFWLRLTGKATTQSASPAPYCYLSESQLKHVAGLAKLTPWDDFRVAVDALVNFNAETLLATRDESQLHYLRGFISGLRKAALLPEEAASLLTQTHVNERTDADRLQRAADARRDATFATAAFRR